MNSCILIYLGFKYSRRARSSEGLLLKCKAHRTGFLLKKIFSDPVVLEVKRVYAYRVTNSVTMMIFA